jgi:D-alanine-D-alanine ligase
MLNNKNKKIAVVMGGWKSEREVSLASGEAVYQVLINIGYQAVKIDFNRDIFDQIKIHQPDLIFNALHGTYGEDGRLQGLLDIIQIPYTHSGLTASAICMDKILTRKICATVGIKSPRYTIINKGDEIRNNEKIFEIGKPFVIKPINEGSSIGVEIILANTEFSINDYQWNFGNQMIVEHYIQGREVQVAVMGNEALGAIEIKPKGLFYDYKCKYTPGQTEYIMPAGLSQEKYAEVKQLALKSHIACGCHGVSRVDFIYNDHEDGDHQFYLLEVNTHPGFTATSLFPRIAKHIGISFEEVIEYLIANAVCR